MTLVPYLLDSRPKYLGENSGESILLLPGPEGELVGELARSVAAVTAHAPVVLPSFTPDDRYEARLRMACPSLDAVLTPERLRDVAEALEPSDVLLLVSPTCYPADGMDLRALCRVPLNDARMARHLLAFEATSLRTKEFVQASGDGRLRRIQRYFEPATWPFPAGVIASFVPVACLQTLRQWPLSSLDDTRRVLAAHGIPSRDIPYHGDSFDLSDEAGALGFTERRLTRSEARSSRVSRSTAASSFQSPSSRVHETARVIGPVSIADGAVVAAGALVIGPSLIGRNARVEADAVVAQSLILPGATVAPAATVRQRVVIVRTERERDDGQRRHSAPGRTVDAGRGNAKRRVHVDYLVLKALADWLVAAVALVMVAPLLALIALLVRVTSPGPVFFGDLREGKDGRIIRCWKFRSMRTNSDVMQRALIAQQKLDGPQFKMDADPRITTLGNWLRRLNLDELPQLWNVVRGEMSLVGPRPSPFRENQICVPWRQGRLSVRPGITGLWQVCRHDRALGDFHQWIQYDLLYVRNQSFALDLKILLATIVTLGGKRPVPITLILGPRAHGMAPEQASTTRQFAVDVRSMDHHRARPLAGERALQ